MDRGHRLYQAAARYPGELALVGGQRRDGGHHFILDSYRAHRHPVAEFFPGFALNGGRVVWEYSSARSMKTNPFPAQRLALENLEPSRRTFRLA
jgi:hypothetical protein